MPIRPPPLKLKYDNRFPLPIPSARKAPVKESFFAKLYRANWRNFVIAVAGFNALRYFYSCVIAYQDSMVDIDEQATQLALVSIALCVMYALSVLIELFGVIGVSTRRFGLVRAYTFLAFVSATMVTAASVLRTASFFLNAQELMYECVQLALSGHLNSKSEFRRKPWPVSLYAVGVRLARDKCSAAWTHESWVQIINVFIFGFMPSLLHYLLVYTHYRQTTDPSHSAYMITIPSSHRSSRPANHTSNHRQSQTMANAGYARVPTDVPYAGTPQGETNSRRQRSARLRANANANNSNNRGMVEVGLTAVSVAPTAAGRTTTTTTTTKGLKRSHRPPALVALEPPVFTPQRGVVGGTIMQSAAALSSWLTPGPPTFGVNAAANQNRLHGMQGIALSCSGSSLLSARYDKFV